MRKAVVRVYNRPRFATGLIGLFLVAATASSVDAGTAYGKYLLNCQGCHKADGSGQRGYVPDFRSSVAQFLALPEGRAYLGRVPGTAQSLLNDADRAEVLNWIVTTFDPKHIPAQFTPYTAAEMAIYRGDPLSQAGAERMRLVEVLSSTSGSARVYEAAPTTTRLAGADVTESSATTPPAQFALCAACHPTSSDGASAMGPNLRGVVGRRAGTLSGFTYSGAMKASGITWTPDTLDEYLTNVQRKVPGTMMTLTGVADPKDRAAIIGYLGSLH